MAQRDFRLVDGIDVATGIDVLRPEFGRPPVELAVVDGVHERRLPHPVLAHEGVPVPAAQPELRLVEEYLPPVREAEAYVGDLLPPVLVLLVGRVVPVGVQGGVVHGLAEAGHAGRDARVGGGGGGGGEGGEEGGGEFVSPDFRVPLVGRGEGRRERRHVREDLVGGVVVVVVVVVGRRSEVERGGGGGVVVVVVAVRCEGGAK